MSFHAVSAWRRAGLCALLVTTLAPACLTAKAQARAEALPSTLYRQECAACHVAYPPGMLPAASWRRILSTLSRHYGTDASLDAASVKQLTLWLAEQPGGGEHRARAAPPEDRITRSPWFVHEHDEVAPATWKRSAVRSPSNCAACHTRANQGDFNERFIHIPR